MASVFTLDGIAEVLSRHHQRATYGAVAELLGLPARSVMQGRKKAPRYSWIVGAATCLPTGYAKPDIDPALNERGHVISDRTELRAWLAARR